MNILTLLALSFCAVLCSAKQSHRYRHVSPKGTHRSPRYAVDIGEPLPSAQTLDESYQVHPMNTPHTSNHQILTMLTPPSQDAEFNWQVQASQNQPNPTPIDFQNSRIMADRFLRDVPEASLQNSPPFEMTPSPSPAMSKTQDKPSAAIIRQNQMNNPDGSFAYDFETENGISAQVKGFMKNPGAESEAQVIQGQYSYVAPDGTPILTRYYADDKGFHAEGAHIPADPYRRL